MTNSNNLRFANLVVLLMWHYRDSCICRIFHCTQEALEMSCWWSLLEMNGAYIRPGASFIKKVGTINLKIFVRSFLISTYVGFIKPSQDVRTSIKMRFTKEIVFFAMLKHRATKYHMLDHVRV